MAYGETMEKLDPCTDGEILELLGRHCPAPRALLDAGCGRGDRLRALATALPNTALYGLDRDGENATVAAIACPGAAIICGDLAAPPWDEGTFDAILCECTLSLTGEPAACLGQLARLLRPGGTLLLGDLCAPGDGAPLALNGPGLRWLFFRDWLERAARAVGFRLLEYLDKREALLTMAAEMILDGSFCDCVGPAGAEALKTHRGGYGVWLFRKENT